MSALAPTPDELDHLIHSAFAHVGETAALAILGVHRTTLMRWRTGKTRIPPAALALLRIWSEGRLPGMGADWIGFTFSGDTLVIPSGVAYSARELAGLHWRYQAFESANARVRQLESIVYDLSRKLHAQSGASNEMLNPANPPRRPKTRTAY